MLKVRDEQYDVTIGIARDAATGRGHGIVGRIDDTWIQAEDGWYQTIEGARPLAVELSQVLDASRLQIPSYTTRLERHAFRGTEISYRGEAK